MTIKKSVYKEPTKPVGTVAELFAGVGGFRIGLAAAGWKTVFSNQWEPSTKVQHASDVYVARFGEEGIATKTFLKLKNSPRRSIYLSVDFLAKIIQSQRHSTPPRASEAKKEFSGGKFFDLFRNTNQSLSFSKMLIAFSSHLRHSVVVTLPSCSILLAKKVMKLNGEL